MGHNKDTFQLIHISKNFSFSFSLTFVWQNMSFSLTRMNKIILAKESLTSVIYIKTFRYFFSMAGQKKKKKSPVILIILTIFILFLTTWIFLIQK